MQTEKVMKYPLNSCPQKGQNSKPQTQPQRRNQRISANLSVKKGD